jgi:transposase
MSARRYELTDFEWSIIAPLLPDKPRGVPRADDRKVLNGIYWRLRTGSPWADIPERYGPPTTCYNRFVRWEVWRLGPDFRSSFFGLRWRSADAGQFLDPGASARRQR